MEKFKKNLIKHKWYIAILLLDLVVSLIVTTYFKATPIDENLNTKNWTTTEFLECDGINYASIAIDRYKDTFDNLISQLGNCDEKDKAQTSYYTTKVNNEIKRHEVLGFGIAFTDTQNKVIRIEVGVPSVEEELEKYTISELIESYGLPEYNFDYFSDEYKSIWGKAWLSKGIAFVGSGNDAYGMVLFESNKFSENSFKEEFLNNPSTKLHFDYSNTE